MAPKQILKKSSLAAAAGGNAPTVTGAATTGVAALGDAALTTPRAPAVASAVVPAATVAARQKKEEAARKKAEKETEKKKKQEERAAKKAEKETEKKKKQEAAAAKKAETARRKAEKQAERTKRQAAVKPWQFSKAQQILKLDIKEGLITLDRFDALTNPHATKAEEAYKMRPEFQKYSLDKFEEYLESMRVSIEKSKSRAIRDNNAVMQFREIHPKPPKNHRGEPRWEGSNAEELLKASMDEGNHKKMKPKELRKTKPEFQQYNPKTFSSHIEQEIRARKFTTWLQDKNAADNKKLGRNN